MSVTQYIGARYVPLFADPIDWDNTREYEPLTIVYHQGNSYTSRQSVPKGIDIGNNSYWALTGNYNAQVEQYRREVKTFDGRITANAQAIAEEVTNRMAADESIRAALSTEATARADADSAEATARADADRLINESISAHSSILHTLMRQGQKVVIFSDSTFQTNSDPRTHVHQKSIADFIAEKTNADVVNLGHGGYNTRQILNQMNDMSATEIADADYVIIASGTNDWQAGFTPLPILGDGNSFESIYENVVKKAQTLAPTAQIICVAPAYIHSDAASDALNMNHTGNTYKTYCDVIAHVAHKLNVAVLRLDEMVGINEYNYTQKMVPSGAAGSEWANIWVHYAEATNDKISDMIAYGMYATNANTPNSGVIDVTPSEWYNGVGIEGENRDYYGFPDSTQITVKQSAGLTTNVLTSGVEYWFSFRGAIKATINDTVVCDTTNQCVSMFPIIGNGEAVNIHIQVSTQPAANDVKIIGPMLTIGRPNIYDAVKRLIGYKKKTVTNENWSAKITKAIANTNIRLESTQSFTLPNGTTDAFPELPITGVDGFVSGICTTNAGWTNIDCRININGKMYLNKVPDGFGGSTVSLCTLFGVAF